MKKLKTIVIIAIALVSIIGVTKAIEVKMTPNELKEFSSAPKEDILGNVSFDFTTATVNGVTVNATSTEILARNYARKYAAIVNDSDETIYLNVGNDAELNKGIRLNANGGTYEITESNFTTGAINGISTSGSKIATTIENSN